MAYPDDFDTSAFPAGKRIALSRTAGIWVMVSFFLIILCSIAIPWLLQNKFVEPFVIYVDGSHGNWELVGRQNVKQEMPYYASIQRALVGGFVQEWFSLSANQEKNDEHWKKCDRKEVCANRVESTLYGDEACGIYCLAGEDLYKSFITNVVPLYQTAASFGERWYVDTTQITVTPNGAVSNVGGNWIARANVRSSINGNFEIIAYIRVERDTESYPQTLGYYVTGFNAYREQ